MKIANELETKIIIESRFEALALQTTLGRVLFGNYTAITTFRLITVGNRPLCSGL